MMKLLSCSGNGCDDPEQRDRGYGPRIAHPDNKDDLLRRIASPSENQPNQIKSCRTSVCANRMRVSPSCSRCYEWGVLPIHSIGNSDQNVIFGGGKFARFAEGSITVWLNCAEQRLQEARPGKR
jgi:hypothetical protein